MAAAGSPPAAGTPEWLRYTYFMHYAEGSLMPLLFMKLVFGRLPSRVPFFMRPVARAIASGADKTLLVPQISQPFRFPRRRTRCQPRMVRAANEFTAADIQMSFPIEAASSAPRDQRKMPKLQGLRRPHPCPPRLQDVRWKRAAPTSLAK